ncbi:MAG: metallophosphoesterase family protein, partial [Candidatus Omnitrophota bacterium]
MKIAVISDTHIPERAAGLPPELLRAFQGVDMIIHAGDLAELKVLDVLKKACPNVKAVWGNMDSQELRRRLPEKQIIKIGKHTIGLMHGYGAANNLIDNLKSSFKEDKVDLIIFGHSHRAMNQKIGEILFFNPGSPL